MKTKLSARELLLFLQEFGFWNRGMQSKELNGIFPREIFMQEAHPSSYSGISICSPAYSGRLYMSSN